jgi:hypothetical protein
LCAQRPGGGWVGGASGGSSDTGRPGDSRGRE